MSRPGVPVIIIDKALCKKCYNCVNVCTAFEGVYEIGEDGYPYAARPQHCVQCLICHTVCPTNAIRHENYRETLLIDLKPVFSKKYYENML